MSRTDPRIVEALRPLYFEAGAGLADCQGFEYGIALLLHHFGRLGVPGLEPAVTIAILDGDAKRTAGQLIHMLKTKVRVSVGLEAALAEGLAVPSHRGHGDRSSGASIMRGQVGLSYMKEALETNAPARRPSRRGAVLPSALARA